MAQSTKTRTKGTGRRPSAGAGAARSQAGRSRASYGTASSKSVRKNTAKGGGASSRKPAGSASGRKTAGKLAAGGGRPAHTENARRAAAREQAIRHRDARARDERNDITLVVLLIITAFLFLSLLNFGGGVGHVLAYVLFGFFGIGAWFVPFYLFAVCLFLVTGKGGARMRIRLLAILALLLILEAAGQLWLHARGVSLLNLKFNASSIFRLCANRRSGGGILGGAIAHFLYYAFRMVGSCLILFGLALVDLLLLFPFSPTKAFGDWRKRRREDGRLSFAQRRAMRHHQMELSEWEREEERLERETDRILRRDEEAERRSSLKEARIRRKGVSPISLEQTLLKRNDEKAAERKAPQGGRRGGGKTGKAGAGSRPRRDLHEIRVFGDDLRDPLTIPADAGRDRTERPVRPGEGSRPDPEGTRFFRIDPGKPLPEIHRSDSLHYDKMPDPLYRESREEAEGSSRAASANTEVLSPAAFEKAEGPSPEAFGKTEDPSPAAYAKAEGPSSAVSAKAGALPPVPGGERTGKDAPAEEILSPSPEDLDGISVHREREKSRKGFSPSGRIKGKGNSAYVHPPFSLLDRGAGSLSAETERELKETAYRLQETLRTFGVQVTITDISQGPAVTRYELRPDKGVKVSRIVNLSDDIKLRLAATDIRIEAPIPGKSAVGIEVPNKNVSTVHLRELLESRDFKNYKGKLPFAVGKDIGGKTIFTDIARMPHLLIAGATGSGKSVCINTIILSILYSTSPDQVKLLMIDPKVVELSVYKRIPHLIIPVVTDARKASAALNWAVAEMEKRYKLFAAAGARDLNGFNALASSYTGEDGEPQYDPLPRLVVIVDELADLMMVAKNEVESAICRLAQLARAAGIHLIIATQRPSVDVITGLIKANMPSRIAFAVSSQVDSRTILDMGGAEKLIGKGDMLFYPQNYQKPARIQGAFVSDEEVSRVVAYITSNNKLPEEVEAEEMKEIDRQIESIQASGIGEKEVRSAPSRDEYFEEAGRFIIEKNKASIGHLQRVFKIGFNRAARIMDQLAEAGVVSEESSTRARQVLMTLPEFEAYLDTE